MLRVTLGLLFLAHAGLKIFVFTPAGTAQFFGSLGLPGGLAYLVIAAETLGGVALILGVYSRARRARPDADPARRDLYRARPSGLLLLQPERRLGIPCPLDHRPRQRGAPRRRRLRREAHPGHCVPRPPDLRPTGDRRCPTSPPLPLALCRRSPPRPCSPLAPHRIGTVSLVVRDLDAVSRFYEDAIGLQVLERSAGRPPRYRLDRTPRTRPRPRRAPPFAPRRQVSSTPPSYCRAGPISALGSPSPRSGGSPSTAPPTMSSARPSTSPIPKATASRSSRPSADQWPVTPAGYDMPSDPLDVQAVSWSGPEARRWNGFPDGGIVGHMHLQVGAIAPAETFYRDSPRLRHHLPLSRRQLLFGSGGYHHQIAANIWNSRNASPRKACRLAGLLASSSSPADRSAVRGRRSTADGRFGGDHPP